MSVFLVPPVSPVVHKMLHAVSDLDLIGYLDVYYVSNNRVQLRIQDFQDGGRQPLCFGQRPIIWEDFFPKTG